MVPTRLEPKVRETRPGANRAARPGQPPVLGAEPGQGSGLKLVGLRSWVWLGACAAAALVLYWFPPDRYGFYPRCWLHELTGLQCPGCGGLRAAHRLLHGDLAAAWQLNPLVFVVAGWLAGWAGARVAGRWVGRRWAAFFQQPAWGWALLGLAVVFGIVRNVPLAALPGLTD